MPWYTSVAMSEKMPMGPTPEKPAEGEEPRSVKSAAEKPATPAPEQSSNTTERIFTPLTPEEEAEWESRKGDYEEKEPAPEAQTETEQAFIEILKLMDAFESEHSLAALNEIIDLTPQEAPLHPIRQPAKLALEPILTKMNELKGAPKEQSELLYARYKKFSRAVGMINNNKVDHNR
jgi:hypothetical protein